MFKAVEQELRHLLGVKCVAGVLLHCLLCARWDRKKKKKFSAFTIFMFHEFCLVKTLGAYYLWHRHRARLSHVDTCHPRPTPPCLPAHVSQKEGDGLGRAGQDRGHPAQPIQTSSLVGIPSAWHACNNLQMREKGTSHVETSNLLLYLTTAPHTFILPQPVFGEEELGCKPSTPCNHLLPFGHACVAMPAAEKNAMPGKACCCHKKCVPVIIFHA